MSRQRTGPKGMLAEAHALRDKAADLEEKAYRAALEACDWFEAPAADVLGVKRSAFKKALTTRFKKLGDEAARKREESGYKGGSPLQGGGQEDRQRQSRSPSVRHVIYRAKQPHAANGDEAIHENDERAFKATA